MEVVNIKCMPRSVIILGIKKLLKEIVQYIPSKNGEKNITFEEKNRHNNKLLELQTFIGRKDFCLHLYYDFKDIMYQE